MTTKTQYEEPCSHDNQPCTWDSDYFYSVEEDDEMRSDLFCIKCGRFRDWSKEELP
jgi:hypothetical protein